MSPFAYLRWDANGPQLVKLLCWQAQLPWLHDCNGHDCPEDSIWQRFSSPLSPQFLLPSLLPLFLSLAGWVIYSCVVWVWARDSHSWHFSRLLVSVLISFSFRGGGNPVSHHNVDEPRGPCAKWVTTWCILHDLTHTKWTQWTNRKKRKCHQAQQLYSLIAKYYG